MLTSIKFGMEKCGLPIVLVKIPLLGENQVALILDTGSSENSLNKRLLDIFPGIAKPIENQTTSSGLDGVVVEQNEWVNMTFGFGDKIYSEDFAVLESNTFEHIKETTGLSIGGILCLSFIVENKISIILSEFILGVNEKIELSSEAKAFPMNYGMKLMGSILTPVQFDLQNSNQTILLMVDSGSNECLIDRRVVEHFKAIESVIGKGTSFGSGGSKLEMDHVEMSFLFDDVLYESEFSIVDDPNVFEIHRTESGAMFYGTLGCDFLSKYGWVINFEDGMLYH